jgi:uncharacterized protein with HEPN domain
MPSRTPRNVLSDIQHNIDLAREFVAGFTFEAFAKDRRTLYAVTRCLEIISEASRRLPSELKQRYPDIPWTKVAGAGSIYRHDYEDVDARIVWLTVQDGLEPLRKTVAVELTKLARD